MQRVEGKAQKLRAFTRQIKLHTNIVRAQKLMSTPRIFFWVVSKGKVFSINFEKIINVSFYLQPRIHVYMCIIKI